MRCVAIYLPLAFSLLACSNPGSGTGSAATIQAPPAETAIEGTPAPGSKFSRIRIGMGKREIQDLIGEPTDQDSHVTGKAFIPFYFGGGTSEIGAHYKGEGILTYASRSVGDTSYELIGIKVDPQEHGYVH